MKIIRQSSNKGFILTELLIVLLIISLMLPLNLNTVEIKKSNIENRIVLSQLEAIANRKTVLIDADICPLRNCWYNPRGNINKSRTINIEQRGVQYELVIWLGFGRFKISERIFDD